MLPLTSEGDDDDDESGKDDPDYLGEGDDENVLVMMKMKEEVLVMMEVMRVVKESEIGNDDEGGLKSHLVSALKKNVCRAE